MPILSRRIPPSEVPSRQEQGPIPSRSAGAEKAERIPAAYERREIVQNGLLQRCANPGCRSGWLHLGRSRSGPIFENGWNCSPECTAERVACALARELDGRLGAEPRPHRLPLGLLMLEQGWITTEQLKKAREAQRCQGGRLGEWLVRDAGISEALLTRALSLQWSCPVLPLGSFDPQFFSPVLPRLFAEAFGALPLRIAAGKLLYLGYEERPDPVLAFALARMSGLRVESGLVQRSQFIPAHASFLAADFPGTEFFESVSATALVRVLTRAVERTRPLQSRLVRVHDWLWLRIWCKRQAGPIPDRSLVQDVICTLSGQ
jgi:hypothetical protein